MMTRAKRLVIAAGAGIGAVLVAMLPLPGAEYLVFPGLVLASPFWPQGIHSSHWLGPVGVVAMIATVGLGTAGFWGGVVYAVMTRRQSRR
jgi:hypothetical protein